MLSCHDATRMMSEAQERRLGVLERVSLRLHLAICAACRRFDRQLPLLRRAMRTFRDRPG